ncbi:MAG: hypothetical protein RBU37_18920 [Myxococcota bacterium]|jgi:hypothetical protein|nr:hypothetical protein [Myxococcota bacterium]
MVKRLLSLLSVLLLAFGCNTFKDSDGIKLVENELDTQLELDTEEDVELLDTELSELDELEQTELLDLDQFEQLEQDEEDSTDPKDYSFTAGPSLPAATLRDLVQEPDGGRLWTMARLNGESWYFSETGWSLITGRSPLSENELLRKLFWLPSGAQMMITDEWDGGTATPNGWFRASAKDEWSKIVGFPRTATIKAAFGETDVLLCTSTDLLVWDGAAFKPFDSAVKHPCLGGVQVGERTMIAIDTTGLLEVRGLDMVNRRLLGPMGSAPNARQVDAMTVSADGQRAIISTREYSFSTPKVYYFGGNSWLELILPGASNLRVVHDFLLQTGQLYIATDSGVFACSWNQGNAPQCQAPDLVPLDVWALLEARDGYVWAATDGAGAFRRSGTAWQPESDGLDALPIEQILPISSQRLMLRGRKGIHGDGASLLWELEGGEARLGQAHPPTRELSALRLGPAEVYVGSNTVSYIHGTSLWRSAFGTAWEPYMDREQLNRATSISVGLDHKSAGKDTLYVLESAVFARALSAGASDPFTQLSNQLLDGPQYDHLCAFDNGARLLLTSRSQATSSVWQLQPASDALFDAQELLLSPSPPADVELSTACLPFIDFAFVYGEGSDFLQRWNGSAWEPLDLSNAELAISDLAIFAQDPRWVLLSSSAPQTAGVFLSNNYGMPGSWTHIPYSEPLYAVAFHPTSPNDIYAASLDKLLIGTAK